MNQVSSSAYRPVCIGLHWPERIGPSRKVRFVQKTALRRNTSRNTLQASLSGTFRQRKDVVNRCLEFAPEDDVPMHLPNRETDGKSNRCKSVLCVGVAKENVKCWGAWENMLRTEGRHLRFWVVVVVVCVFFVCVLLLLFFVVVVFWGWGGSNISYSIQIENYEN